MLLNLIKFIHEDMVLAVLYVNVDLLLPSV